MICLKERLSFRLIGKSCGRELTRSAGVRVSIAHSTMIARPSTSAPTFLAGAGSSQRSGAGRRRWPPSRRAPSHLEEGQRGGCDLCRIRQALGHVQRARELEVGTRSWSSPLLVGRRRSIAAECQSRRSRLVLLRGVGGDAPPPRSPPRPPVDRGAPRGPSRQANRPAAHAPSLQLWRVLDISSQARRLPG